MTRERERETESESIEGKSRSTLAALKRLPSVADVMAR